MTLGSDTITYVLDGQGRRVAREENGVVKDRFLYKDFINPVAWQDAGGSVAYFVYGGRGHVPDWMVKGGAYYRLVTDHLGSVRRVVNVETGTVAQAMDYDEWGNVIADSNPGFQPFGYAGGLYDGATGLVHFGFREYSPQTGRWMSKDPIGFGGGENFYGYLNNSPVTYNDPLGLRFPDDPTGAMHLWGTPGYVADAIRADLVSQGYMPTDASIVQLQNKIGNQWSPAQQRDILRNFGQPSDLPDANCAGLVCTLNNKLNPGDYSPSKIEKENPCPKGSGKDFGSRGHLGEGHVFSSLGNLDFDQPPGSFTTILETNGAAGSRLGRGKGLGGAGAGGYTGATVLQNSNVYPAYNRMSGPMNSGGNIRWYEY